MKEQKISGEQLVNSVYSRFWQQEKVHGPDAARTSLVRRAKDELIRLEKGDWALDLGAGRQAIERQLMRHWRQQISCNFATLDIAELKKSQLMSRENVQPVRASGANLPFRDATFSVGVSSMGLELMPTEAIPEFARVMKPGGKVYLNILHPSVSSWKRDDLMKSTHGHLPRKHDQSYADFWSHYARENNVFGKGEDVIGDVMEEFGFQINRIETAGSHGTSWIEIDATRTDIPYGKTATEFIEGIGAIDTLRINEPFNIWGENMNA